MNYSDSKFYKRNGDLFVDLNNDIYRIMNSLDNYTEEINGQIFYPIRRLLVNMGKSALEEPINKEGFISWDGYEWGDYSNSTPIPLSDTDKDIVDNSAENYEERLHLSDILICRTPMIPSRESSKRMGSYITINLLEDDLSLGKNSSHTIIAIDTWTPPSQWIINDGLRSYVLCSYIQKAMNKAFRQNDGVKYRLTQVINAKLSDDLLGFRLVYEAIIEN